MIRDLLEEYRIHPDRERGQHFLDDQDVIDRMVDEADLEPGETVVEIGAGLGVITRALAETGAHVVAYENDRDLLPALEQEMDGFDTVDIRAEDVMEADLPDFDAVVANPPFHLSSDLIDLLAGHRARAVLLFQEEFARKLVAEPGEDAYARISATAQFRFLPVYLDQVPQRAFEPEMDVSVAMVKLFPRNDTFDVDGDAYDRVVRALFVHRMKKVRNAVVDSRHLLDLDRDRAKEVRDDVPHSQQRVRDCSVHDLVDITRFLRDHAT